MRRRWLLISGISAVAVAATAFWKGPVAYEYARTGSTYVAKLACSCLLVSGRPLESCQTDFDTNEIKPFSWNVTADSVTISAVGGFVSSKAVFEDGFGCHPVN